MPHSPVPRCEGTLAIVKEETIEVGAVVYGLEILAYLPAENVQSLERVCKDWLQLIRSSYFVRLHLSRGNGTRIRVLVSRLHQPGMLEYNNYCQQTNRQLDFPPLFSRNCRILGSADGLIFMQGIVSGEYQPGIFNPSTGKCSVLQPCPRGSAYPCFRCSWFGNLTDGEYVLVLVFLLGAEQLEIWTYNFTRGSNILNRICSTQITEVWLLTAHQKYGTLAQGVVHWPIETHYMDEPSHRFKILAYDLGKNKHRMFSPPVHCDFRLGLFVDGCSLMATSMKEDLDSVAEVWIMKGDCWAKYANIVVSKGVFSLTPVGFFPNGDLIMDVHETRLMRYSFEHEEATPLMEYDTFADGVIMCADTLVSPFR